jgi:hypothetical protein
MKTQVNPASRSKINYTALLIQVVTLLVVFDVIPAGAQDPVIAIVGIVGPALIQVFRTWFTEPKA